MTDSHSGSVEFASLGPLPKVMAGIRQAGFTHCTPIQAQTLPIALAGRDVAGQAQTGTGKTAAFLVALYQALLTRPAARTPSLIAGIRYILRRLPHPERRQSMLFSATLSHRVLELAYEHMNNPETVRIEPDKMTVDEVRQLMYYPSMEEKVPLLIGLLHQSEAVRTLVFVNTKRTAERLESTLKANGFNAQALSGDVPQHKRLRFLRDFHDGKLAVLIATDVASRGLHIPDVSHVFNFDLPQDAPDYVHRIGRTARAGAEGDALSFACEEYAVSLPEIESYVGHKIPFAPISPELLATGVVAGPAHSHRPRHAGGNRHGGGRGHGGGGRGHGGGPRGRRGGHPPRAHRGGGS